MKGIFIHFLSTGWEETNAVSGLQSLPPLTSLLSSLPFSLPLFFSPSLPPAPFFLAPFFPPWCFGDYVVLDNKSWIPTMCVLWLLKLYSCPQHLSKEVRIENYNLLKRQWKWQSMYISYLLKKNNFWVFIFSLQRSWKGFLSHFSNTFVVSWWKRMWTFPWRVRNCFPLAYFWLASG